MTGSGWGGSTFEEADRANEYEEARAAKYWEARETAADKEVDAIASAALLMHPDTERVEISIRGERLWVIRTGDDEFVIRTDEELRTEEAQEP